MCKPQVPSFFSVTVSMSGNFVRLGLSASVQSVLNLACFLPLPFPEPWISTMLQQRKKGFLIALYFWSSGSLEVPLSACRQLSRSVRIPKMRLGRVACFLSSSWFIILYMMTTDCVVILPFHLWRNFSCPFLHPAKVVISYKETDELNGVVLMKVESMVLETGQHGI